MPKAKRERKGKKPFLEEHVNCAWCGKPNVVRAERRVVTPGVPAQTKLEVFVEKDDQKNVDDFEAKKPRKAPSE